jgi:hypothetical protein
MTSSSFATHRRERSVRYSLSSHWLACLLAVLVLGLGRPGIDMPLSLVSDREIDPVEQEDSESEEEMAIHCRGVFRRRVPEHAALVTPRFVCRMSPSEKSHRLAALFDCPTPHDSDVRNGLGATLRC